MKQKTIATRHLRTKIAAGYVLILFVIFGIVYIWLKDKINARIRRISAYHKIRSGHKPELSREKRREPHGPVPPENVARPIKNRYLWQALRPIGKPFRIRMGTLQILL